MIYNDPPYGIRYDSNFQQRVDVPRNDEKDKADDIVTIKAFRDTWALGVHSYLSHLQERFYLSRDLLSESGSIIVQMGIENAHLVGTVLDEVFGAKNFVAQIAFRTAWTRQAKYVDQVYDVLLWYAKDKTSLKYRPLYATQTGDFLKRYDWVETPTGGVQLNKEQLAGKEQIPDGDRYFLRDLTSQGESETGRFPFHFDGQAFSPRHGRSWSTRAEGMKRLVEAGRIQRKGNNVFYKQYHKDFPVSILTSLWVDTAKAGYIKQEKNIFVVQTPAKVIERCMLMTTDPGDLVFDPTCGSGTTAFCAENFGRRWITCDTSRVALNVARKRLLGAVFKHYRTVNGGVSSGFSYRKVPHVTLKSIASGQEPEKIDLVGNPEETVEAIRVTGPFEMMTIGRYSIDDWKGYVRQGDKLENYINVMCRLYMKGAAVQGASGLIHAVAESEGHKIAISIGPLSGRVTAKQISDAVEDAIASGINEIHVLGWAFEANVGEITSRIESRGKTKVNLVMIRPDTLAEGLKAAGSEALFAPFALPDVEINHENGSITVALKGVAVFDRKTRSTAYKAVDSGYISAWYVDEDYDGDCFVDCQMFFQIPDLNLDKLAQATVPKEELSLQTASRPFRTRGYKRIAVKVIDVFGNESTVVKELGQ